MRLVIKTTVLAHHSVVAIANPDSIFFEGDFPIPDKQQSRRGYFAGDGTFITQVLTHDCWLVPVRLFSADLAPTAWQDADRVVAMPIRVGDYEELLLGGWLDDQDHMKRIQLAKGDYTVYSVARNLFVSPTQAQLGLSAEEFAELGGVESYDFILVPERGEQATLLMGPEYLFNA